MSEPVVLTTSNADGNRFELTDTLLRRYGVTGGKPTEREVMLANVQSVRIGRLGQLGIVELTARDGQKVLVVSDREPSAESKQRFREFVGDLHERLVAGKPVEFIGGMQHGYVIAALVGAVIGAVGMMNPWAWTANQTTMLIGLGVLVMIGGIVGMLRNRKRFYDPLAIPPHLLP